MSQLNNDTGEIAGTPSASPAGTITPEPTGGANPQGTPTPSPEEVAFNSLKGDTQTRFKNILTEKDEAAREAEYWKQQALKGQPSTMPTPTTNQPLDVRDAVQKLSDVGIATKDEVKSQINQGISQMVAHFELERLSEKYDGSTGLPRFERAEYEDYVQRNPQYQNYSPEDVYNKMYQQEILDAEFAKRQTPSGQSTTPTLQPNAGVASQKEPLSLDLIEQRLKEPGGKDWYVKNKEEINNFVASQRPG